MSTNDIDKAYVSPYDTFLFEFDAKHTKTPSQRKEAEKHERLARMRDDKDYQEGASELWEEF